MIKILFVLLTAFLIVFFLNWINNRYQRRKSIACDLKKTLDKTNSMAKKRLLNIGKERQSLDEEETTLRSITKD